MTKIEAMELELKARKMVQGTGVEWWSVIRRNGGITYDTPPLFRLPLADYEPALGIIEGKPVWKGDTYYHKGEKLTAGVPMEKWFHLECSWNPPTQKTVMVELLVEDARNLVRFDTSIHLTVMGSKLDGIATACRKALEELK